MNPELKRNLWLELTTHRLIAMPVVLLLGFLFIGAIGEADWRRPVSVSALVVFAVLTLFWGSRLASDAVAEELRARTWDLQRMSALSPWTMTWGKLVGATAFAWYGGLLCLLVYFVTTDVAMERVIKSLAALVLAAVMAHAIALAATLQTARRGWNGQGRSPAYVIAIAMLMLVPSLFAFAGQQAMVHWYGMTLVPLDFLLLSLVLFAPWAVLGAYRLMAVELQLRSAPLAWLVFIGFSTLYLAGLNAPDASSTWPFLTRWALAASLFCLALTYLMLLSEAPGPLVIRRLLYHAARSDWRRVAEAFPCWPLALIIALVAGLVHWLVGAGALTDGGKPMAQVLLVIAILAIRDAAILYSFALGAQPRRVEMTAVVYVLVLDWLIPGILSAMDANVAAGFVFPVLFGHPTALLIALVQAALAVGLCVLRWRKFHRGTVNV